MSITNIILCIIFVGFASSYAWAMRGTVIGGEKGAMLPGAYIGLILALFAGGKVAENFWIPAAAGLIGMSFGGIEPYGDTISMVLDRHKRDTFNPRKGYTGLAVKGALWFSVAGGLIGLSFSAMGGRYSALQLVIFCVLIPVVQSIGYAVFDLPYNKEKGINPKIYFCYESREEWGSNAGILLLIIAFSLINLDKLALAFTLGGLVAGAVGWLFAMFFFKYTDVPLKSGKYLFGKFKEKKLIDGWKNMEFSLGAIGSTGLSLAFILCFDEIKAINNSIAANGIFSPLKAYDSTVILVFVVLALALIGINTYEFICDSKDKKYNSFVMDCIERPLFNVIPLVFVLLCSQPAAKLMTVFMLIFALALKNVFDRFDKSKIWPFVAAIFGIICAVLFAGTILCGGFGAKWVIFAGGLPYWLIEIIWRMIKHDKKDLKHLFFHTSFTVVLGYELIQIIIITVTAFIIL